MSTTRSVSMIGSITSSDIRDSLLFWIFNVSNEFKFSNADAGNTEILINKCQAGRRNKNTISFILCHSGKSR